MGGPPQILGARRPFPGGRPLQGNAVSAGGPESVLPVSPRSAPVRGWPAGRPAFLPPLVMADRRVGLALGASLKCLGKLA
ncbi:unnamed protein product [Amoebophrya sp. A120]|nr:unnamed protein product [Amoebophrya sp. A120]|eukprot:GSA120T00026336001.1